MLQGSCLCGKVRYEVDGPVADVHNCHCSMCRKSHGSAFSTFAQIAAGDFRFVDGRDLVRAYRSSPPIERSFCSVCGTRLTFRFDGMPEALWVSFASLDAAAGARPSAHIFATSKAPWFEINDDLPQFPEYGPVK